ncbi:hypothetical protein N658DRAFT_509475 [Parathielavia hyrcaniae]|uniref:Uncharacterized protein n=1 Tax=Parathielavia hyrcaniae TaxID=113614 RepID=A0AAN6PXK3_9PEZI|nr:hypothetical protein N658DRAFT_509475 [Parathielavia hyrcaniae]
MKVFALLALAGLPAAVLGTPTADTVTIAERSGSDTSCNPYKEWGSTRGSYSYYCASFGDYPRYDFHCVKYKNKDYCSGKAFCRRDSDCSSSSVCHDGICVKKVKSKYCRRTCDPDHPDLETLHWSSLA